MNYKKYRNLPREKRIRKYQKIFSRIEKRLLEFGLTLDDSAVVCDLVLDLSNMITPGVIKYKGVYKRKNQKGYYAKITKNRCYYFIGNFPTARSAATAYDEKSWALYRKKTKLNFPNHYILI